jgi:hypothetical protein
MGTGPFQTGPHDLLKVFVGFSGLSLRFSISDLVNTTPYLYKIIGVLY